MLACGLFLAGSAVSPDLSTAAQHYGYSVNLTIGYHSMLTAEDITAPRARELLAEATSLIAQKDDHPSCGDDWTACVNLVPSQVSTFNWGTSPDVTFPDEATLTLWLEDTRPPDWPNIKVFKTIKIATQSVGGFGLPGAFNSMVAVWSSTDPDRVRLPAAVWAHEIGHNCALPDYPDKCVHNIMRNTPLCQHE